MGFLDEMEESGLNKYFIVFLGAFVIVLYTGFLILIGLGIFWLILKIRIMV